MKLLNEVGLFLTLFSLLKKSETKKLNRIKTVNLQKLCGELTSGVSASRYLVRLNKFSIQKPHRKMCVHIQIASPIKIDG